MGNVKMVNMLTTVFVSFLKKFYSSKMYDQHFPNSFRLETVHELPFSNFSSLMDLKKINKSWYKVNSPFTNTS